MSIFTFKNRIKNTLKFHNLFIEKSWVILPNLVHTGYLQFLAIFRNLAGNEHGFLPKTSKAPINTPKQLRFFLILLDFPCFSYIFSLLGVWTVTKNRNGPQLKVVE